jgi:hypothetical protein
MTTSRPQTRTQDDDISLAVYAAIGTKYGNHLVSREILRYASAGPEEENQLWQLLPLV